MAYLTTHRDDDGILRVRLDDPGRPVNVLNDRFIAAFEQLLDQIERGRGTIRGVVLSSGKDSFFAGADVDEMAALTPAQLEPWHRKVQHIKSLQRRLEKCGRPVVAAVHGAALGGGLELCLACHHRIATDHPSSQFGFPEVTLGLMPGGGGVVRLVRLLGLKRALPLLLEGTRLGATSAHKAGLIDQLATDAEDLLVRARTWILAREHAVQPWDERDYVIPGGGVESPELAAFVTLAVAQQQARTKDLYPAPRAILASAVEGLRVDVDTADRIETRYFVELIGTPVARNMMNTFLQTRRLKRGESRPRDIPRTLFTRVGIVGAGMMGAGIAWAAASSGLEVVLLDTSLERALEGRDYSRTVGNRLVNQGRLLDIDLDRLLTRIQPTTEFASLAGCELVIEAVFEDRTVKAAVTREICDVVAADALVATNTSTLPITGLAEAARQPGQFLGLHFFSPVDRMTLVEIICGRATSPATLARAYDFARQIGKTPIVVNDSRGFFTSRVYESFCDEGAWLLSDGVPPALIDNLAEQAGMPAGPLAAVDAVSQQLIYDVKMSARRDLAAAGQAYPAENLPPFQWAKRMVEEFGRRGKAYGAGYFEYPKGEPKYYWPELVRLQPRNETAVPDQDVKDRILFRQSIEAVRCLQEGVLRTVIDGNVGSLLGIGFPPWTGGQLQYINSYGVQRFADRSRELADRYGERFEPPALLIEKARTGEELT